MLHSEEGGRLWAWVRSRADLAIVTRPAPCGSCELRVHDVSLRAPGYDEDQHYAADADLQVSLLPWAIGYPSPPLFSLYFAAAAACWSPPRAFWCSEGRPRVAISRLHFLLVLRGLPKFFDIDVQNMSNMLQGYSNEVLGSCVRQTVSRQIVERISSAVGWVESSLV